MIFDILFEIILVLVILFGALLWSKGDVVAGPDGYTVEAGSLILTFGILIFYLVFMISVSIKKKKRDQEMEAIEANKEENQ